MLIFLTGNRPLANHAAEFLFRQVEKRLYVYYAGRGYHHMIGRFPPASFLTTLRKVIGHIMLLTIDFPRFSICTAVPVCNNIGQ